MKPVGTIALIVAGLSAATMMPSNSLAAGAGSPNDTSAAQSSIQSRIDQLARPQPQPGEQPANPAATAPAPGGFPRSFLIPGTDTSIRIGGSIDGTATYYGR
jgi:hypothetical protein